jgi:hypothetical protein
VAGAPGALAQDDEASAPPEAEVSGEEQYRVGQGFKLSEELRLEPSISLMGGFQTNVFYEDQADRPDGSEVLSSPVLKVGVGARISNDDVDGGASNRLRLQGDVGLTWNQYLSGENTVSEQSDLGVNAIVAVTVNPLGAVTFEAKESFTRSVNPPPTETEGSLDRDRNELMAGVTVRPGGGALAIYGKLTWQLDLFEDDAASFANRQAFIAALGTKWQWLPKTQFNGEASFGVNLVEDDALKVDRDRSTPLRVWVGASTLITPTFGTILRIGYGNGFYDGENFNSYIALAEARYAFGPAVRLAGGYSHDFADALVGNFRADHALYARFAALLAGRFQFSLKGEVRFRDYGGIPPATGAGLSFCAEAGGTCVADRADVLTRLETGFDMQANEWLTVGASYTVLVDSTDSITTDGAIVDSNAFTWQEFLLKATAKF